jgi:hypothetical protein
VTKYKRVYRSVFGMSHPCSELPPACRYDRRRPVVSTPALPHPRADGPVHAHLVELAGEGGRAGAARHDKHMQA